MQYKVPQNVDIEDKVIAGLTLKQFIYIAIAGGLVLMIKYALPAGLSFLFMPIALFIGTIGLALAFVKVNERPLEIFLLSAMKSFVSSPKRYWEKDIELEPYQPEKKVVEEKPEEKKNVKEIRSNLERLAMIVDSGTHGLVEERTTNVKPTDTNTPPKVTDILDATEKPSERLDKYIEKAKGTIDTSKEKPISALASVAPTKDQFRYEQIETKSEDELNTILQKTREQEEKTEEALESAKIEKF